MLAAERARPDGIEVVAIMTAGAEHGPQAVAALEAGLDVPCDKPLATSPVAARELAEAARRTGRLFAPTR